MRTSKRIISFIMVAVIMISVFTLNIFAAGEQISVSLISDKQYAQAGDILTITINVESNYNATCMRWPILYSNSLELVGTNGEFDSTSALYAIGGSSVINPTSNEMFLPEGYSSEDYSALLIQWTGGVEDNNVIVFNQPSGLDCYTIKFKVKDNAVIGETGDIFIPQTPSSYTPFYNQAVIIDGSEVTPYKATDLAYTFYNATVTFGEEPGDPEIIPVEGSNTIVDNDKKIIYGLDEAYYNINNYIEATDGGEINIIPTANGNGTGTVVQLKKQGEVLDTYTVMIYGDLSGDAVFDETDIAILNQYLAYTIDIPDTTVQFIAGDLTKDLTLDELDKAVQNRVLAYIGYIDQATGGFVDY